MKKILDDLWNGEPVLVLGLIRALVVLGASFLAGLTKEQTAALYAIVEAVTLYYTRQQVWSPESVRELVTGLVADEDEDEPEA